MWLLKKDVAEALNRFRIERGGRITAEEREQWSAATAHVSSQKSALEMPRIMQKSGKTATIRVEGVLTKKRDIWAWLFYGANTAYTEIQSALAVAEADSEITEVIFDIDSPGGNVDGWFDCLGAIENFSKKMSVKSACSCSAAYGIACATGGKIEAANRGSEFGSVGVAVTYLHDEALIDITSTEAPDKRPDPTTEEGKAVIRKELDAIHGLFADVVARGRGTTVADVNENFGRGGVLIASDAKKRGMIDSIAQPQGARRTTAAAAGAASQPRKNKMDENELKAQHPELYAAVFAKGKAEGNKAGFEEGQASERKRVQAHLKLAEATGATKVAHEAIAAGKSTMDEEVFAEYQAAAFKRNAVADRDDDAAAAAAATKDAANGSGETAEKDLGDSIVAVLDGGKSQVKA